MWDPSSDIWQCLWHAEPFHAFRIGCFAKAFNGWLPLNVFEGWLCPTCVMGTWLTSWIDVILIWYHYIVICTLVTIFNWWLSSKDMKLRVLIKEVLVVFHLITFRIIRLCSLASGHLALFSVQETIQQLLYIIYIYIYIYNAKNLNVTSTTNRDQQKNINWLKVISLIEEPTMENNCRYNWTSFWPSRECN